MEERIVIHAGLPKTGTSAIQRWLLENDTALVKSGVLYPRHPIDPNGISSGNFRDLTQPVRGPASPLEPSPGKIAQTLKAFTASPASTLLLSSERMWITLEGLAQYLPPSTQFIVYIRDPVALVDSSYNQRVKRHGVAAPLTTDFRESAKHPVWSFLPMVPSLLSKGLQLSLRPYHDALFQGGNLLDDFLHTAGLPSSTELAPNSATSPIVNRSYSLHALEYKRSLNALRTPLPKALDKVLQSYPTGPTDYSLISPEQYLALRQDADKLLRTLSKEHGVTDLEPLRDLIADAVNRPYLPQEVAANDLEGVVSYIREKHPPLHEEVSNIMRAHPNARTPYAELKEMYS